jgi:hypothetical protein
MLAAVSHHCSAPAMHVTSQTVTRGQASGRLLRAFRSRVPAFEILFPKYFSGGLTARVHNRLSRVARSPTTQTESDDKTQSTDKAESLSRDDSKKINVITTVLKDEVAPKVDEVAARSVG